MFNKVTAIKLKKRSGGRYFRYQLCGGCKWRICTFIIINDGILYFHKSKDQIKQFLHFGKDFQWKIGNFFQDYQIFIYSYHRKLTLKATSQKDYFLFVYHLNESLKNYKKNQQKYRFNSFAPVRQNNSVKFFIDGSQYFQTIAYHMQHAKKQVFICGWWVSPEFHLVRPCQGKNLQYRLDKLLKKIASKNNIKIYIIVYYQSSFLTNDSQYTINALTKLHSNIKVLRHPQIILPTFWSHHQKLVVIDQQQAFLGGLDLCYGRYDDSQHLINDNSVSKYPGIQYNNCRIKDFINVKEYWNENVSRNQQRLPWHDVALLVKGIVVKDLSRHFIQYWNYASYQTHYAQRYVLISKPNVNKKTDILNKIKKFAERIVDITGKKSQIKNKNNNNNQHIQSELRQVEKIRDLKLKKKSKSQKYLSFRQNFSSSLSQKKPYHLPISQKQQEKQIRNYQLFSNYKINNNQQKIQEEQRQQAIQFFLQGQEGEEEEQDNKEQKILKQRQRKIKDSILQIAQIQIFIDQQQQQKGQYLQDQYLHQKNKKQKHSQKKGFQVWLKNLMTKSIQQQQQQQQVQQQIKEYDSCQVLRSASQWSIGCRESNVQKSIASAYGSIILKAKKFIYIQNQFFISATKYSGVVKNFIMDTLSKRIIQAINMKQDFRVIILMPLIPGFAGQLNNPDATLPRVIMHWQYKTICRGQNSLLQRIKQFTQNPQKYIQFYSVRNHGYVNNEPKTQIIYLHSKLIIVDDCELILGSANINDRSMQGDRDSQLCLMIDDNLNKQVIIGGQKTLVHPNIHNLRVKLWKQHFALPQKQCQDPLNPQIRMKMIKIAKNNTELYRNIFGCYPDNNIKKLSQINQFKKIDYKLYEQNRNNIIGHIVEFPLNFLSDQKLTSLHPNQIST